MQAYKPTRAALTMLLLMQGIPVDSKEGFTLTERWFSPLLETFYPAGTTIYEIVSDMLDFAGVVE